MIASQHFSVSSEEKMHTVVAMTRREIQGVVNANEISHVFTPEPGKTMIKFKVVRFGFCQVDCVSHSDTF